MVTEFNFSGFPDLVFGTGKIKKLPFLLQKEKKKNILVIWGKSSLKNNAGFLEVLEELKSTGYYVSTETADREPTPALVDEITGRNKNDLPGWVIGAGGGSVMDTAKAVSAMLTVEGSVKEFLEGFPEIRKHPGTHIPLIAIPTTSGTGSEATKNAVISEIGMEGYKRSLRHNNFVPDIALVDPELVLTCPASVTASSGMDALTQLLESYVSTRANPVTDSLAFSGLHHAIRCLEKAYLNGMDIEARTGMAYAALISGITLANAGLGTVHGFASSVGGRFDIPHGVICGTLLAAVTEKTIQKLKATGSNPEALKKYSSVGKIFHGSADRQDDFYLDHLIMELHRLTDKLKIPKLTVQGFDVKDIPAIAENTSCKNNPVPQSRAELEQILNERS